MVLRRWAASSHDLLVGGLGPRRITVTRLHEIAKSLADCDGAYVLGIVENRPEVFVDIEQRLRGLPAVTVAKHPSDPRSHRDAQSPKLRLHTHEDQPRPPLRRPEVSRINDSRNDTVGPGERKITLDLPPHGSATELAHANDVLDDEGLWPQRIQQRDELAVKPIARVVYEPVMIANLAECLTRRPSYKQVQASARHCLHQGVMVRPSCEIALHEGSRGEIPLVRRAGVGIVVGRRDDVVPGAHET